MQTNDIIGDRPRIHIHRGNVVESRHRVSFAVAGSDGQVLLARGKTNRPVFPRSAVKMLQAISLVETGAADHFHLTAQELSLACASHNGEPRHVDAVTTWLEKLGLSPMDLECGAHLPSHAPSMENLLSAGDTPSALHNNCSGKHAGMLTLAKHLGVATKGYSRPDHPVQELIADTLKAMSGIAELPAPAIDGCGIPTFAIPLDNLALAMARFAAPARLPTKRQKACHRIAEAMRQHPEMVAGLERPCTLIMQALPGVVAKTGAEGVYTAAWPDRALGIALKVEDGATRASSVALLALLDRLGAIDDGARRHLQAVATPTLKNHAGTTVGHITPDATWSAIEISRAPDPKTDLS